MLQGNPGHTGAVDEPALLPPLRTETTWKPGIKSDNRLSAPALVAGLAIANAPSHVVAFDPVAGRVLWRIHRLTGPLVPPAIEPDAGEHGVLVYTEGQDARNSFLTAVDLVTRELLWRFPLRAFARGAPTIADGKEFVGTRAERLYAVDLLTGHQAWGRTVRTEGTVDTTPAVDGGQVFALSEDPTTGKARIYAWDEQTGRERWSYSPVNEAYGVTSASVAGGLVYAGFGGPGLSGDLSVRAFDGRSGEVRWSAPVRQAFSPLSTPAVNGPDVFFADRDGGLYRFDAATGRRVWDYQLPSFVIQSAPLIVGGYVYIGLEDGTVAAVDVRSGELAWTLRLTTGAIGPLVPDGERLLAVSIGRLGGIAAFLHDPQGRLLAVQSPTRLHLPLALSNFIVAFAVLAVAILGGFRLVLARAGRGLAPPPHDGSGAAEGKSPT
jgi:outer membrane protein assembly factor BamB